MKPKILHFIIILLIVFGGVLFLSLAGKASAERIRLNESSTQESLADETSNTDFIFFGSISRIFAASIAK